MLHGVGLSLWSGALRSFDRSPLLVRWVSRSRDPRVRAHQKKLRKRREARTVQPHTKRNVEQLAQKRLQQEIKKLDEPWNKYEWKISILGRPNVGKSTLFNRLCHAPLAIVDPRPGVTRDRKDHPGSLSDLHFQLVDTAGLEEIYGYLEDVRRLKKESPNHLAYDGQPLSLDLQEGILAQTREAVFEADIALFMFDAREGVTELDIHFAKWLRKQARIAHKEGEAAREAAIAQFTQDNPQLTPGQGEYEARLAKAVPPARPYLAIIAVANKCENDRAMAQAQEVHALGFGTEPVAISAAQGEGMGFLYNELKAAMDARRPYKEALLACRRAQEAEMDRTDEAAGVCRVHLSIVGRPNVGKSTLLNALLGRERVLTGEQPGVTRDSITVQWQTPNLPGYVFELVDTAGLRGLTARTINRFGAVDGLAMHKALHAVRFGQVVALVLDPTRDPNGGLVDTRTLMLQQRHVLTATEMSLARTAVEEGRALVVVLNKMDLLDASDKCLLLAQVQDQLERKLPQAAGVPIVALSARTGVGLDKLLSTVVSQFNKWEKRIGTGALNAWLRQVQLFKPPPNFEGKQVRCQYVAQVNARPPTFAIFCTRRQGLKADYIRFLQNALREEFGLSGIPIRTLLRTKRNPYDKEDETSGKLVQRSRLNYLSRVKKV